MNISKECNNYIVQSIALFLVLTFCGFGAMQLWSLDLTAAIIVSGCFVLVIDIASAYLSVGWPRSTLTCCRRLLQASQDFVSWQHW